MRETIVIATPTLGMVSTRWALNFRALAGPMNGVLPCLAEQGYPVDIARNRIVLKCLDMSPRPDFIFWIDDDVLCHPYALLQLRSHQRDIVGGVYFCKHAYAEPLIFDAAGANIPYHPSSGLHRVHNTGGGLTLVRTAVYADLMTRGMPWDDQGNPAWYYTAGDKPDEHERCNEDVWFARLAAAAGYEWWCDTSPQAFGWHLDPRSDTGYPIDQWEQFLATGTATWKLPVDVNPSRT